MISANTFRSPGGISLLIASCATFILLAFHPHIHPESTAQMLRQLADPALGGQSAHVHGAIIAVFGLLLVGVIELAHVLGLRRTAVGFGLAVYALGSAAVAVAMLFDGFITSQLASVLLQKVDAGENASQVLDAAPSVFALVSVLIQVFTKAGSCAMGIGMACLSWSARSRARALAWLGLAALLPPLATIGSGVWLGRHQLMAVALCQALWYLAAAAFLLRHCAKGKQVETLVANTY